MRQAGRYMPEYRALREEHTILELIKSPEMAAEVTLQPIEAFELDAAIIFADILTVPEAMGLELEFVSGEGPIFHNPIGSSADVEKLRSIDPREYLDFTIKAVKLARAALAGRVPLIGFSGAPFTLACYAIEGGSSRDFTKAKAFMHDQPSAWHMLMERLSNVVGEYLLAQAEAGAQALQLFDSWVGHVTPEEYAEFVMPYSAEAIRQAKQSKAPLIHFGTGTGSLLPQMKEAGGDVIGVDSETDLVAAWDELGKVAVQGNLDPKVLAEGSIADIRKEAGRILFNVSGRKGHIFNLGHGARKDTPPENVAALVDFVHKYTSADPEDDGNEDSEAHKRRSRFDEDENE